MESVADFSRVLPWFGRMIGHCCEQVRSAKECGRPLVGIMCEFTPREVILAAGAVPVCLCGGSLQPIAQAERYLPSNLCPLIKSTFGFHITDTNPLLTQCDLLVAETTCDGKKKMFELMSTGRPMYLLELPQKSHDADAMRRWTEEIGKLRAQLESRFGGPASDDGLRQAIELMNRERALLRQIADLMALDRPPLSGRQLLEFRSIVSGMAADQAAYQTALEFYRSGGVTWTPGLARNGRPVRVLMTGVPVLRGAERVVELIEASGGLVVCMESCTGLRPILEDVVSAGVDPTVAIANKYYHLPCSVMTPNADRLHSLQELAAKYRPDCIIELVWQACLTYDVESHLVRTFTEQELRLPYLKITTDYSPNDSARIAARVDALLETIQLRRDREKSRTPNLASTS